MKYLTIAEFADHMRVHYDTVRRWKRDGMPCVYVGKRMPRVVVEQAEQWLIARAKVVGSSVQSDMVVIH